MSAQDFKKVIENARSVYGNISNRGVILLAESGYNKIVKSLRDEKAWEIQESFINNYFRKGE